ncbi:MAG: helix-turn-helix domain-containing protein [Planctomycetota bacterium]
MDATHQLFAQLESRRVRLGMSKADLARRAGVSVPTVQRLLSGRERRARTDIIAAIAAALGVEVRLSESPHVYESSEVSVFREAHARAKAKRLARLVQGTMALEAEAVGTDVLEEMEEQNVHALLAGSGRRLWGE